MTRRTRRPTTDAARGSRWNTLFYRRSGDAREKLHRDAVDCALISKRATDARKEEPFDRLADHLAMLASELERAIEAKGS
jgi:hypothetical protein